MNLFRFNNSRRTLLLAFDVGCFLCVDLFYFFVAYQAAHSAPVDDISVFYIHSLAQMVMIHLFREVFRVYKNVWRYSNTRAYLELVMADGCGSIVALLGFRLLNVFWPGIYTGLWQFATVGSLNALIALVSRFVYSLVYNSATKTQSKRPRQPAALIGAGRLGAHLVDDIQNDPDSVFNPLFFIDIDGVKIGNRVAGLSVYDHQKAERLIKKLNIQDVIISITNKSSDELSKIYYYYRDLGCKVHIYDPLGNGKQISRGVLRDFSVEDLLFRDPVNVNNKEAVRFYRGKTVLITGGGGSVGSELCRQIAKYMPAKLVIFDIYENNAYDIQQELIQTYEDTLDLVVEIGSVRDTDRLDELFRTHRPDVVFHAAAHKHVPLMENCGSEAIKNNCFGTYNTANAAEKYGAKKFILISTDKAVNPTNIMGATKRLCEMIIQCRGDSTTSFSAVRFGNVLGSNGSVIPLFKRQIAAGGPVTITDKRIIRYFMTIPEASQLVLLAGAMAKSGELFVFDMGKPVRIYDLAVNMIQLSGLEVDRDIKIEEIGLRPGEKLYEELLMKSEHLDKTENDQIFIERDRPESREAVEEKLRILQAAVKNGGDLKVAVATVVPTYCAPDEINAVAENSEEMASCAM